MAKTANVFTRVDPEIKENAESIPFEVKLPGEKPLSYDRLSEEEFDEAIQEGYDDILNGRVVPSEQVKADMKKMQPRL